MKLFTAAVLAPSVAASFVIESGGSPGNAVAFLSIVCTIIATINLIGAYADWSNA